MRLPRGGGSRRTGPIRVRLKLHEALFGDLRFPSGGSNLEPDKPWTGGLTISGAWWTIFTLFTTRVSANACHSFGLPRVYQYLVKVENESQRASQAEHLETVDFMPKERDLLKTWKLSTPHWDSCACSMRPWGRRVTRQVVGISSKGLQWHADSLV